MSSPQWLQYQKGGLLWLDLLDKPDAVTIRIADRTDSTIQSDTDATISSINTTTNCVASAGDVAINVSSNIGIASGVRFWLQDDPEEALARKVSGETVYLRRPLLKDHVNMSNVEGTRVTFIAAANVANTLFWDGRAEWNVLGNDANTRMYFTSVECTRYPVQRLCTSQDLFDVEPKLYHILDSETDVERLLDMAHDHVLMEIAKTAPDMRARVFTGSMEFSAATALAALYLHYRRRATEEGQLLADRYEKDFQSMLSGVVQQTPRDADQDTVVRGDERQSTRTVRIFRA